MDDEVEVRNIIKRILEREGHEVEVFEDARPALDTVDFSEIDTVIIDLQMPTSGFDAIEEIRNRGHKDLSLIVVSTHVDLELTPEMLDVQEIVHKPFTAADMAEAVAAHL
jgi:DNA-binding response OmpR family regulator